MKIVTIGRGAVGAGLAGLWKAAGHQADLLGREGGDASQADVVLVAVPGDKISHALSKVTGLEERPPSTRRTSSPSATATSPRTPRK